MQAAQHIHRRYAAFKEEFSAALRKELECTLDLGDAAAVGRRRACVKLAIEVERAGLFKAVVMLKPTMRQVVRILAFALCASTVHADAVLVRSHRLLPMC